MALALVVVLWLDARASWVLAVPAGLVLLTYHLATKDRARQGTVSFLYETTKALQGAGDAAGIAVHVLSSAREIVRAETASLLLRPIEPGGPGLRTRIGPGDLREVMEPVDLDPARSLDGRLAAIGEATLLGHPITDPGLAGLDAHEAMVVPLAGRDGTAGVLVVTNRVGGITSFHADELQLLQTLGYHTGIALENLRLVSACATRPSTTTSPAWPTAPCCLSGPSRPSPGRGGPGGRARRCCWTWTGSRPSTTASGTRRATSSC
jgi:hypothetical protein